MKKNEIIKIPTLKFNSEYFHCPKCGWEYPGPMLVKGDSAPNNAAILDWSEISEIIP